MFKMISFLYNIAIISSNINNEEYLNEQNDLIKYDPNIEFILIYECKTRLKIIKSFVLY